MRHFIPDHLWRIVILLVFLPFVVSACNNDDISTLLAESGVSARNIGNDVQFASGTILYSPSWLHAWSFSVPAPTTVVGFGVIVSGFDTPGGGEMAKMALYDDASGIPGSLVVSSAPFPIPIGRNETGIPATPIPPGVFWVAIIPDALSYVIFDIGPGPAFRANGNGIPFANPFPDPFTFGGLASESPINIYMKVVD